MTGIQTLHCLPAGTVKLGDGAFAQRYEANRSYLHALRNDNLVQNHLFEAGLWGSAGRPDTIHWGWESPNSLVRGHFLGHWLSAAIRTAVISGDEVLRARANAIVDELERCQRENGGGWVASIPEKYMERTATHRPAWASQYVCHKTLLGLLEMWTVGQNEKALDVATGFAGWFQRWTSRFSREQMDDILDYEAGGLLETFVDLYAVTKRPEHLELVRAYDRRRLFDALREGRDVLTNRHMNTVVPEVIGAARAWEVTGEDRWREVVEAFWRLAVTERGAFVTGGQSSGEIFTPPFELDARRSEKTQEHCTVYNMIRLASFLLRWTGEASYADYIERNLINGVMAQQHPQTGMFTYFLPMSAGGRKTWGTATESFWCCYGTGVQANALYPELAWHAGADGLVLTQFIPSSVGHAGGTVELRAGAVAPDMPTWAVDLNADEGRRRPNEMRMHLRVKLPEPQRFTIKVRIPLWTNGPGRIGGGLEDGPWAVLDRTWHDDTVEIALPKKLRAEPLPDREDIVAFVDGPVVLAGLVGEERTLTTGQDPSQILTADNEREWGRWQGSWRTTGQDVNFRFVPLNEVTGETYTLYFPVRRR